VERISAGISALAILAVEKMTAQAPLSVMMCW
jgi:hypothetical protein